MQAEDPDSGEATRLLRRLRAGDGSAGEALLDLLYRDLHRAARVLMGAERAGHTLQPTALVNEAWLRLMERNAEDFEDRGHFLRLAARAMRRVLVDHARSRAAEKRGGGRISAADAEDFLESWEHDRTDVLAVDEALSRLERVDSEAARIVELRFFAGLTSAEAAAALGRSVRTIEGGWVFARGWLRRELERGHAGG